MYSKTLKRMITDIKKADWDQRLEIFRLRNQGWTFQQIADKMGVSRQSVNEAYQKIKDLTIDEIENLRKIAS